MAKKQFEDLDWDTSLDYEVDDPFAPVSKNQKRGVITRVATNFAQGAKEALTTPASMRSMAAKMLPKGYGEAINFADDIYRQGEELHNIALKELEPSIPAMRRITQRHLPKAKRFLPKSVAEKLQEFGDQRTSSGESQASLDEQAIQRGMAEVFGVQMEAEARQNAENKIERAMQHAQSTKLSRQQLHSLNVMQQGMMRLVNYQDEVTNKYHRRSLELQLRHFMVARDSHRLQVETARRVNAQLDALVTNTAMPDIQKQDLAHSAKQTFRTRLFGAAQNTAGKFAANYFSNLAKRAQAGIRDAAGGINGMMDFSEMGEDGPPMLEMLAQMAGNAAMTYGGGYLGKKAIEKLGQRDPRLAQGGGLLLRGTQGAAQYLNRYARSATKRTGWKGLAEDTLKSMLGTYKMDATIGKSGIGSMDKPATFDRLTRHSIVEIIPGLLARIEHNTARVLDNKAQRLVYNHSQRGFTNVATAANDMTTAIFDPSRRASMKREVNEFVDEILGKTPVTPQTRKQFLRQVLLDSGEGMPFDLSRYTAPGSDTPELTAQAKLELGRIFEIRKPGQMANGKTDHMTLAALEKKFSDLDFSANAPIHAAGVYRSAGYRELLEHQGLIDRDKDGSDKLRLSRILDLIEEADYGDIKEKEKSLGDRWKETGKGFVSKKMDEIQDLRVKGGGTMAVLEAAKLKAGVYRDNVTKKVITSWDEIKGPVWDSQLGQIVADTDTLARGLIDKAGKTWNFELRGVATGTFNWATNAFDSTRSTINKKVKEVKDIVDNQGATLLQGWKLKAGHYRDQLTKKVITKAEDICGPVVDENGNVVITAQQIANVVSEKGGRPMTDALARMRQRTESMSQQAAAPLDPVFGNSPAAANTDFGAQTNVDYGDLVRLNTEQVELLKQISQILIAMGPNGGSGQDATFRRGFLDSLALGGIKGAWKGTKALGKGAWWWTKNSIGTVFSGVGLAGRGVGAVASGASHRIGNMVRGIKDIYVQGKRSPVMIAQRIKMGHYQDVNTKKKITRWTDVTGPVVDVTTGETILDQDDFNAGIYVKGPAGLVRLATKSLMGFGSAVVSFYGMAASMPFRAATWALKGASATAKWLFNKQVDVYVKGESSPRLQASKMKTGRYYNAGPKKTGKVVSTYEDIYGEIKELAHGSQKAAADDKTVLYENEIHDPGLVGRWGMSLRTPFSRMLGAVGGAAVGLVKGAAALFGGAMKGYGKLFGGLMGLGGGLIGAPFKFLGALLNPFEKHGAKQVMWLEKIHNVLDARLPGKKFRKGSWQEQFANEAEKDKAEKEEKQREEKDRKWGVGGLLSFFKDKAKGLFGGGDEEEGEEGDEDGGDTTIIGGGGGGDGDGKRTKDQKRKDRMARAKAAGRRKGKLGALFRAKDSMGRLFGRIPGVGKLRGAGRFVGSPAKMAAGLAAATGGSYLLDKTLGEDSSARKAVSTGADVAGTAATASWLSGLVGGPTISSALGIGGTAAATAGTAAAATGGAAAAGGAAATAGTAAAAAGGTAAAVIGAPIWVPIAIGVAAAAAIGAGIYYAHKQYKYGKLTPVRRFRYLQYGVPPGDAGNNKKIFQLEEMMLDHVGDKGGGLEIVGKSNSGGKDITMEDVYDLMDMEDGWFSDKKQQRMVFNMWYSQRFKPIFLTWVKALRGVEPTMSLLDADEKLTGDKLSKVLKSAWGISRNLYAVSAGPFDDEPAVTDFGQIEDAYNLALKEAGKSEADKKKDARKDTMRKIMNWTMPGTALLMNYMDNKRTEEQAKKEGAALSAAALEKNSGALAATTGGKIKNTQGVDELLTTPLARLGKVTALAAIRYRTYGVMDLDLDRVRAMGALEAFVLKKVSIASSGNAYLTTDAEQIYYQVCGLFGLAASSPKDRLRWCAWFGRRFFPTFRAYIKAVRDVNPSADLLQPERTLKADALMNVAQQMLNAKDDDGGSVWFFRASPWSPQEQLNTDSNSISGSMLALKASADKKIAVEQKLDGAAAAVNKNRSMMQDMMDTMKYGAQKASDWLLGDKNNRNWLGKAVDGIGNVASTAAQGFTNAYEQAKQGNWGAAATSALDASTAGGRAVAGALGFGPGLNHPGKGTGGDINQLPQVPSNAEIANMAPSQRFAVLKPLFDAVAKMTGVDPNMLYAICSIESTFNPGAKAPTSSASGLFQFIRGTWSNMLAKYGKVYGLSPSASPFDPRANALMGAMFLKENFGALKKRMSRGINETDMYMAHFMGAGGAGNFLTKDPNAIAAQLFPKEAAANKWIFYKSERKGGRMVPNLNMPLTIGGVYQLMQQKVNKAQAVYGGRVQGGKADFSDVTASVSSSHGDTAPSNAIAATPTTTTTTANGPTGGVGAAQKAAMPSVGTPVATQAGSSGTSSLNSGGGYAALASGAGYAAAAAPSITSTASLDAAAASQRADEADRAAAVERERQAQAQRTRAAEAQSVRQSQSDQAVMSRVGEILQQSLEAQKAIQQNTADTVSVLRDMLRKTGATAGPAQTTANEPARPETRPASQRPTQRQADQVPVSVRFAEPNG